MPFPAAGTFSSDAITVAGGKGALEDFLASAKALAGGATAQTVTLSGGVMTAPTTGIVKVNSTGNLDNIPITTLPAGSLLYVIAMAGQTVTIRHSIVNVLLLFGDSQYVLNNETMGILFYRNGNAWQEISRFGRETAHVIGSGGGEPGYVNGWGTTGLNGRFLRDPHGNVRVDGGFTNVSGSPTVIFTLPAGYRPPAQMWFPAVCISGGNSTIEALSVASSGDVSFVNINGIAAALLLFATVAFRTQ